MRLVLQHLDKDRFEVTLIERNLGAASVTARRSEAALARTVSLTAFGDLRSKVGAPVCRAAAGSIACVSFAAALR